MKKKTIIKQFGDEIHLQRADREKVVFIVKNGFIVNKNDNLIVCERLSCMGIALRACSAEVAYFLIKNEYYKSINYTVYCQTLLKSKSR